MFTFACQWEKYKFQVYCAIRYCAAQRFAAL